MKLETILNSDTYFDSNKKMNLYHSLLVAGKKASFSKKSNNELREQILHFGGLEKYFNSLCMNVNLFNESPFKATLKDKSDFVEKINEAVTKENTSYQATEVSIEDFPVDLKKYKDNSPIIYYKGDLSLSDSKTIAFVGTRKLKPELVDIGKRLVKNAVKKGYTITSGLAKGCDTLAHKVALENGGKTIAVLGTPINKFYPAENRDIQKEIGKDHLLVSQYPVGIQTFPNHFALRNITTVSLSKNGVFVLDADDRSGTRYAINCAIEQSKPIYLSNFAYENDYKWVRSLKENPNYFLREIKGSEYKTFFPKDFDN